MNLAWLGSRIRLAFNKRWLISRNQANTLSKTWFLIFCLFHLKSISQIASKIFAAQFFFHWPQKVLLKQFAECLQQIFTVKSFPTAMIFNWGFQDFHTYLAHHFWLHLNSSNLVSNWVFEKINGIFDTIQRDYDG